MKDFDFLLEEESSDMNCQICSYENNDYLKTVVAFANTNGGKLLFGLDERKREIIGIDDDSLFKVMDTISKSISNYCELEVLINIYVRNYKNKYLIIVEIPKGALKPYYIKGNSIQNSTYIRKNGITSLADTNTIKELILDGVYSAYLYQTSKKIKHSVTNKPRLDDTNDTKNVVDTNLSNLAHDTNDTKNVADTNLSSFAHDTKNDYANCSIFDYEKGTISKYKAEQILKLLTLIKKNPWITQKEISKILNVSLITVKRLMLSLQFNGNISRYGSCRKGKW
ncbi:MAG: putative DNA binding domain-containing protein, partial [Succinivibrio sp.]|nr:putative DNA binding domain-containing protein [Succinivibrio sp.]